MKFDIKTITDERAFHNTAILIFLKAADEVFDGAEVRIGNSLNQGYFSYRADDVPIRAGDAAKLSRRMKGIIAKNLPIITEELSPADAMKMWKEKGCEEKVKLLEGLNPDEKVEIAEIDGYKNCMYSKVLPSTGYIRNFEIRVYRKGVLLRLPNMLHSRDIPVYRDDDKLYAAYRESNRMRNQTGIYYVGDANERIREGEAQDLIDISESYQSEMIGSFADRITRDGKRIVLISGPSSSGKTTTAKRLCQAIARRCGVDPLYMGTDDYFVERCDTPLDADGKPNFEGLDALDLDLFNDQMDALLAGKEVDIPEFDFVEGKKVFGKRITKLQRDQIMVIEGIHSLNDVLTENIDRDEKFKVYISPLTQMGLDRHNRLSTVDTRLLRRIVRDNQFRAYDARATLDTWPKVRAGESEYVFPYSSSADVVFNSSTLYETNLLRTFAEPLLEEIKEGEDVYPEAQRILNLIKLFEKIESADGVPANSILREFVGPKKK